MLDELVHLAIKKTFGLDFGFSHRLIQQIYKSVESILNKINSVKLKNFILIIIHNQILKEFLFLKRLCAKFVVAGDEIIRQKQPIDESFSCDICQEDGTHWIGPNCNCSFLKCHSQCYKRL